MYTHINVNAGVHLMLMSRINISLLLSVVQFGRYERYILAGEFEMYIDKVSVIRCLCTKVYIK